MTIFVDTDRSMAGQSAPEITPRQREIIALVAEGFSNREIGERLGISEGTVKNHLQHIFERVGVRKRVVLAALIFTDRLE